MPEHTDAERLDLIERILLAAPPTKSIERMGYYKQVCFRIEEDSAGWPSLRETLDKQLDGKLRHQ